MAASIKTGAAGPVGVVGYTDSVGDPAYNQTLSENRAAAVVAALQPLVNGAPAMLQPSGKGAADPVAPNQNSDGSDNPAGRAQNRRVTISYTVQPQPSPPAVIGSLPIRALGRALLSLNDPALHPSPSTLRPGFEPCR